MEIEKTGNRKEFQKNYLIILIITTLIFIFGGIFFLNKVLNKTSSNSYIEIKHELSGTIIRAEIADDDLERYKGLMYRTDLSDLEGMFFIFNEEAYRTFWMKDTPTSLDMIFLDKDLKVVKTHRNTLPNQTTERYSSEKPAQFVIEVKSGFLDSVNVNEQDSFKTLN